MCPHVASRRVRSVRGRRSEPTHLCIHLRAGLHPGRPTGRDRRMRYRWPVGPLPNLYADPLRANPGA